MRRAIFYFYLCIGVLLIFSSSPSASSHAHHSGPLRLRGGGSEAYNRTLAEELMKAAAISYCLPAEVSAWKCDICRQSRFKLRAYFESGSGTENFFFIATDESAGDILIAFRGTEPLSITNWIEDFHLDLKPYDVPSCSNCLVEEGFHRAFHALESDMTFHLSSIIVPGHPYKRFLVTGHSLGAAIATLAAPHIQLAYRDIPVALYTYGTPRTANANFVNWLPSVVKQVFRHQHERDIFTGVPPILLGYLHEGVLVYLDSNMNVSFPNEEQVHTFNLSIMDHANYFFDVTPYLDGLHGIFDMYATARHLGRHVRRWYTTAPPTVDAKVGRPIYLDLQATTPTDPRVLDAMMPYLTEQYGNPHSRTHSFGWVSADAIEEARQHVAQLIGADKKEIIFTSGATESNNLALKGVARFYKERKKHIITTQTEHKCVLDSCRNLQTEGFDVTYLPVQSNGLVDINQLEAAIRPDTAIVSIMAVNNEIGVIQPMAEIGALCRSKNVFLHTDAAQAVGKIALDVNLMNIDLMSISGHKIYGPKGIGAIYVRRRPRVRLDPIISGGGQERGLRSGTLPTALCVGMGEACRLALQDAETDRLHIERLSTRLMEGIESRISHVTLNGDRVLRYCGNVNYSFSFVEGESLLMGIKNVAVSSGSACTSASLEPSYVLRALGVEEDLAHSSIRFGIGRFTTEKEVDYVIDICVKQVERLREMSPLWEMVQEGIDLKTIQWSQH